MNPKTEKISRLLKDHIYAIDPNADVILYGSRARGEEHLDSDWDLLILTEYPIDLDKENLFRNTIYDLELELEESISLFIYSKSDWQTKQKISPFYQSVTAEGIVL